MWGLITWLPQKIWEAVRGRRQLRVFVQRAAFATTGRSCYFVNVTNTSHQREIEVTHVWFDVEPVQHAMPPDRPLPKRLRLDETWETWVETDRLPADLHERAFTLARARLSTGAVVKSRQNPTVPSAGLVPGGPIKQPPK